MFIKRAFGKCYFENLMKIDIPLLTTRFPSIK